MEEYSKECKLNIYEKIIILKYFEKMNEKYLNTKEGKETYVMMKKFFQGLGESNNIGKF